ncbi:MAG: PKD domain-containing protein [Flavobacteriales bacterium]
MKNTFRFLTFGLATMLGIAAFAQPLPPYNVTVMGTVVGCSPNSTVNITTVQGTLPALNFDLPLDSNCSFAENLAMDSPNGWFQISTPCNGAIESVIGTYTVNTLDSIFVFVTLNCGGGVTDCLGVLNGSALPGTACSTALGVPGTWSASCNCVANSASCDACFSVEQSMNPAGPLPFTVDITDCSSDGNGPYSYLYDLGDGTTSTGADVTHTYANAGIYVVCLTIADNNGCTSTTCDSLYFADNGILQSSGAYDCLGVWNGSSLPGTPCSLPFNEQGTWDNNCVCQPDSGATCSANFIVMQAFTYVDSTNTNPGGTEPIPNEVWVWNQSYGSGSISYTWDFGDGTTSTDAFPTHIYADGGPYVLCLTMTDASNCTSTHCDTLTVDEDGLLNGMIGHNEVRAAFTVNVLQELPTAINEQERIEEIALWPNPVADVITLSLLSTTSGRLDVSILDLDGRLINTSSNTVSSGKNSITVPVEQLESGMYVVRISDGKTTVSRRFVKQ